MPLILIKIRLFIYLFLNLYDIDESIILNIGIKTYDFTFISVNI